MTGKHPEALDPIPELATDTREDLHDPKRWDELQARIRELEAQNNQLLKERDSAVGMAGRISSRLQDALNLCQLEAQSHNRLIQSYLEEHREANPKAA